MAEASAYLRNQAVRRRIWVERYSTSVVRKAVALLNRADLDITQRIAAAAAGDRSTVQLEGLLTEVRRLEATAHQALGIELTDELKAFAHEEAGWQAALLGKVSRTTLATGVPSAEQLIAAVNARPFQGRLLSEWLSGLEGGSAARVRDAIRLGFVEGQTIDQMVRRIRGTKALQYRDGIMEIGRRGADAMVRTAVAHTANVAQREVYNNNSDIIDRVMWVAVLDSRTTPICRSRDHHVWPLDEGPRPPAHIRCRSTTVPILIGEDPPPGVTYGEWLAEQTPSTQAEVLGAQKAALFRTGGLPVEKFTDPAGRELSLEQLRKLQPEAFERAGLNNPMRPNRGQPQDEIARFLQDETAQRALLQDLYGRTYESLADAVQRVQTVASALGWEAGDLDMAAIRFQTGNGYAAINKRMREVGGTLEDRKYTALASRGVEDLPDYKGEVWRAPTTRAADGDRWWDKAIVGQPLDLGNQLLSFTKDGPFAATWAQQSDVVFWIKNPSVGAYVDPISLNRGEEEVLFPPGLEYRVLAKTTRTLPDRYGQQRPMRVIELEISKGA